MGTQEYITVQFYTLQTAFRYYCYQTLHSCTKLRTNIIHMSTTMRYYRGALCVRPRRWRLASLRGCGSTTDQQGRNFFAVKLNPLTKWIYMWTNLCIKPLLIVGLNFRIRSFLGFQENCHHFQKKKKDERKPIAKRSPPSARARAD